MSRSNPHENSSPNPSVRWFEWNGENGTIRYYDKDAKQNIDVGADFTFLLLDQLATIGGWHDASDSGIYANEVKDTRQEVLVVKAFKGGTLAEGFYREIRDRVSALGGQFVSNLYIAFKHDGALAIGSLKLKGAALNAWVEFTKAHRADLFKKAIRINGFTEGKKGRIVYRMPILGVLDTTEETDKAATGLDAVLQEWLKGYFSRTRKDQADHAEHTQAPASDDDAPPPNDDDIGPGYSITDDDIPF